MSTPDQYRELTPIEARIILHKGTEAPFSGEYDEFFEAGTYHCRQCDAPLYRSEDKFRSHCGWPSFDDEIQGAIRREKDADGRRTEILCSACGGHLGHVFQGERLTEKNIRHCVNSLSMRFVPKEVSTDPLLAKAYFAGGCFWGVEHLFQQYPGVISAVSGYMGGKQKHPTYQDVVYRNTGHLEVVEVSYDPTQVTYEELTKYFFEIHDPTQANGQGPDIGDQYLSAIFVNDDEERAIAERLITYLEEKGYSVVTKLVPATEFWEAESYHQDYYAKNGKQPYCHIYTKRF
jgi:peptide methionine sulfoxide reductase msrA/msrB